MADIVHIPVASLAPIEYQGQRVITLSMMDRVHGRPDGTARRNFNTNREKMVSGRHYFTIDQPDEIRSLGLARKDGSTQANITMLTERGYLKLVKSFTDELAWDVQEQLVDGYFRGKEKPPAPPAQLSMVQLLENALAVAKENELLRPKAAAHDAYASGNGFYTISETWRMAGIRCDTLTEWLTSHSDLNWAYRNREGGALIPSIPAIRAGLVSYQRFPTVNEDGSVNSGALLFCFTDRGFNIIMERASKENLRQGRLELVLKAA